MGLIRAAAAAVGTTLADTWLELFGADALSNDELMVRGHIIQNSKASNKHGNDNIISNGSGLLVADGQCAIIVDQGEVVEVCAEPGYYTYDQSTEPSLFKGNLGDAVTASFNKMLERFKYGGDTGKDQRIYYFNTKEIVDNKFGTANPIPFRVVDKAINFDEDFSLRISGVYSFRVIDPMVLYKKIAGNVSEVYKVEELQDQLKTEFISGLQPAISKLSELELRPSQIPGHVDELCAYMNESLSTKWKEGRGIEIVSVALNPITLPEDQQQKLNDYQSAKTTMTAQGAAAQQAAAFADALRNASKNEGGSAQAFVGMNMANGAASGINDLFAQAAAQQAAQSAAQPAANSWTCECGTVNAGKFCSNCGKPAPGAVKCPKCGSDNKAGAKFCSECGTAL